MSASAFKLSRADGAREVKILGGSLVLLMAASYLSFTKKDEAVSAEKVTILEAKPEQLKGISMITRTQTIAFERRKSAAGEEYPWFTIESNKKKRGFKGNKSTTGMIETFNSLGDMTLFSQTGGIAGGIATALFTTQMGLIVAVPGYIIKSLLDRRERQIKHDLAQIKDILCSLKPGREEILP